MDVIHLCAQALCLEEMAGQTISEGVLWYMQTRYHVKVMFSGNLRAKTLAVITQVREYWQACKHRRRCTVNAAKPAAGGSLPAEVVGAG